jgi:hypothetical protein
LTRALAGVALALLGLAPLGAGALMLLRTPVRLGLSIFAGMAAAAVLLPPLVYVGLSPTLPLVLWLGAVAVVVGLLVRRPGRMHAGVEVIPLLVLAAPLALLAARAAWKPVSEYDAFANWALKAKLLYFDSSFSDASIAPPVHREYPLGLPTLVAYVFHCIGRVDVRAFHVFFVAFLGGLALVAWKVLRPYVDAWPLTAGLSLLLWMPAARDQALSAYADVPLACFFVSAVLLVGSGRFALGALFAAAALATKRDALAFCAVLYAVAFAALIVRGERERMRPLAWSALLVALTAVPWRVFDAVHGLHDSDLSLSSGHVGDLPFTLGRIGHVVFQRATLWALPVAAAAAVVMLVRGPGRDRELAAGALALGIGLIAALAVVYGGGPTGVRDLVRSTAARTLITPTLLAAVLLPLLVTRALAGAPRPPRASRGGGDRPGRGPRRARARGRTPRPAPRSPADGPPRPSRRGRARAPSS